MGLETRSSKRIKLDDTEEAVFDDPALQRRASDVHGSGLAGNGFLSGKVFMAWAPASMRLRFIMETEEISDYGATNKQKFTVVFTGACNDFFDDLALRVGDKIALSLKGAHVESTKEPLRTCTLAMSLVYEDGVIMMLKNRASSGSDSGNITNTWKLSQNWFDSPAPEEVPRSISPPEDTVKITKKEGRRRKKARREQAKLESATHAKPDLPGMEDGIPEVQSPVASTSGCAEPPLAPNVTSKSPTEMRAGLQTDSNKYHPIGEVSSGQVADLIGVVVHATSPTQTRTGDWSINLKIVDPSSPAKVGSSDLEAFGINCFTKQHTSWLPQPKAGDVLMLRRIQVNTVKGHLKGTAHHNRFQWAIFSPDQKRVHHEEASVGPKLERRADTDVCWTSFFDPEPSEIDYCTKLSEWWVKKENKPTHASEGNHPIGTTLPTYERMGGARLHRLIKDAGPDVQPNGYFDCTVEVLHGYMNSNEVFSLYITDYTRNDRAAPVQADWCSSEMSDYVLKMEMWDAASKIGPTMEPGTYYAMSNARMRISRGGYLEAKMVLPKITRLNEDEAARIPHLKDLLDRKATWNNQSGTTCTIEDKLIEEVIEDQFFNCVVEVLHVTNSGYGPPCIYATDYTEHPYLLESKIEGEWCKGLEGRIVKISLWDGHTSLANSVTPGFYYSIKKLRLRLSHRGDKFEGELRGRERLVNQLNPRTRNDLLQQLLQRKERALPQSQGRQEVASNSTREHKPGTSSSTVSPEHDQHSGSTNGNLPISSSDVLTKETRPKTPNEHNKVAAQQYISLKEMVADATCPNKFFVRARVVDFYPLNLKDCSKQFCTRCKTDVPAKYKACIECVDSEHECVTHRYQLFLMLEDNHGTRLVVSIYDKSHLFDGLERASFNDNPAAYNGFCTRLSHLLGNLVEVHERGLRGEDIAPETKIHELEVVSWDTVNGKRAYGLYCCRNHEH